MAKYEPIGDDVFSEYEAEMKKEVEEKKNHPTGSFTPREYDTVYWSGLETGKFKAYRFVGKPPKCEEYGQSRGPTDSKMIVYTDVKADDGKRMQLKLPLKTDVPEKDHIVHRLAAKVREVEWIKVAGKEKREKVFKHKDKFPELFELVEKAGFNAEKDGFSYTYSKGLMGQKVVIFNVIDRSDGWCAENKHTKLLSKNVTIDPETGEQKFPSIGVGTYGFCEVRDGLSPLEKLISKYGNFEKYDIGVLRTGEKSGAWELKNLSYLKDKDAMDDVENTDGTDFDWDQVVVGPLTNDELDYDRYDLDKYFGPTSYQKILKRMPQVFKLCDASLGTHFYDELVQLAADEKEKFDEIYHNDEKAEEAEKSATKAEAKAIKEAMEEEEAPVTEIKEPIDEKVVTALARRSAAKASTLSADKIALLKGWGDLTEKEKSQIKDVVVKDGKVKEIVYTDDATSTLACDNVLDDGTECGILVPGDFAHCPVCDAEYQIG
jgi:hypothetical protein